MAVNENKTSFEWYKDCDFIILDPDGWDRKNYTYSWFDEKITKEEFDKRVAYSTCTQKKQTAREFIESCKPCLREKDIAERLFEQPVDDTYKLEVVDELIGDLNKRIRELTNDNIRLKRIEWLFTNLPTMSESKVNEFFDRAKAINERLKEL